MTQDPEEEVTGFCDYCRRIGHTFVYTIEQQHPICNEIILTQIKKVRGRVRLG